MNFSKYKGIELITIYGDLLKEMKKQNLIRSNNVVGDIGEYVVIEYYNKTKGLAKLQRAPSSTKNIDAISTKGERYSIKCTTTTTTGAFNGIVKDGAISDIKPLFEYLVIVRLNKENFTPQLILELDWSTFFEHKKWAKRINAYQLNITKEVIKHSKIIYQSKS